MSLAIKIRKASLAFAAIATLGSGLAATEASAEGYYVNSNAQTVNFPNWDRLNIRAWPASHSEIIGDVRVNRNVYVERCILKSGSDWCKIKKGWQYGWVNGSFLRKGPSTFAHPHPWYY